MSLRIGEVAERGRVNQQTIRYYEREGLLPEPPRRPSGYRTFSEGAVRRVRFIKRAQELGFTLAEVRELLSLQASEHRSSADVKTLAHAKMLEIDRKIRTLQAMKEALARVTAQCSGHGPASECPILDSLDSDEVLE